jgi:site-specific recombinase XerC
MSPRRPRAVKTASPGHLAPDSSRALPATRFLDRDLPTYLDHLAVERGLSAASVAAYRADLALGRLPPSAA